MSTKWFAVLAALNLVFGMTTSAQDAPAGVGTGGEVVVEAPPARPEKPQKPERPERPQMGGVSQEMKELVTEFRSKVADFHAEQKELVFQPEAITELARVAREANERLENIGARRLHTVMATLMEDILFELPDRPGTTITLDAEIVREKLGAVLGDDDLRRYIL